MYIFIFHSNLFHFTSGVYGVPLENGNGDNGYILQGRSGTASAWITIQNHNGGKVFIREIE